MLERKLYSLPAELLLLRGWQEKFKIKAKLSPAEARAELGNISIRNQILYRTEYQTQVFSYLSKQLFQEKDIYHSGNVFGLVWWWGKA